MHVQTESLCYELFDEVLLVLFIVCMKYVEMPDKKENVDKHVEDEARGEKEKGE